MRKYLVDVLIVPATGSVELDAESREDAAKQAVAMLERNEIQFTETPPGDKIRIHTRLQVQELTDIVDESKLLEGDKDEQGGTE